ncbi:ABC transporter permease [Coprococcus catus]|jgi:putative spermidine/putrescine transport system permease protein|uniref:ABC transporter permease n=2 Tax=Coprococcus catus TaxID=116085 RepID=A0A3E2XMP5_9FIRM|nr:MULTISPECIES: ABC transporter permease [Coprococcus]MCQ5054694.1 ABC transporter permease [Agathobaculum butyriciproducens]MEE0140712.1 ABC transporter permease [Coprococcus sp.]MBT9770636.1 ABC transporter permease [Coprococcus catus]MBT9774593.1 ABC transporter permease [Coprococcus catus]MCB6493394.1 ABC transporter permease [Coprococcus catus]
MKKKTYIYLLALVPFLIVAMLYEIVPLITVIVKSFQPDGGTGFTLENYQSVFSKLLYQKAIINSIKISLTSAVAGIIIAFLGARAAHQHQGKLNHVFMTVLNMVSNFAGIPLAFAYMILLGNAGLVVNIGKELGINALSTYNLYTMNGMSLIYIYFQIPLSTLLLIPAFDGVQKQWKEACTLLGGTPGIFWRKVGIPVLMPSILGTFSVLFANALAAYATIYALMMDNIALLPVQIAGCFTGEVKIRAGLGGALSVVMMAIMVIMILITNGLSRRFQKGGNRK